MKNLKKVFAVVLALALMLSSVAFASSFPDVSDDATYATAVDTLAALGLVKGDDKGNFNPDDNIKRSEVAAMLVRAYGQEETASAITGAGIFTDVPASHWANGYIRYASESLKFINGMGDGTFAPDANVTFEQTVKMIVSILGYEDLAAEAGGYPAGYITVASELGILKGVSLSNTSAAAKRSTVAQLLYNGLDTPLRKKVNGGIYASYENQDGKSDRDYATLLTDKLGIYKVTGTVMATSFDSNIPVGQINYTITKSYNFDDEKIGTGNNQDAEDKALTGVLVGDSNAEDLLYIDSEALLQQNDDEDWVVVSIVATGKNEVKELKLNTLDEENSDATELRFFKDEKKTGSSTGNKNSLAEDAKLYVNSVSVGKVADGDNFDSYIKDNENGIITLVAPSKGKDYDKVLVTYAVTAVVDEVNARLGRINFKDGVKTADSAKKVTRIVIDPDEDDDNFSYSIVLDGKEIEVADLEENDVIAISYNVSYGISDSNFYNIIVSRNYVEGTLTSTTVNKNKEIEYYEIAGKDYKVDDSVLASGNIPDVDPGDDVIAYLDIYGNIAYMEKSEEQSNSNTYGFAIALKDRSGFGDNALKMVNEKGETVIYDFADKVTLEYPGGVSTKSSVTATQTITFNGVTAKSIEEAINKVIAGTMLTDADLDPTDATESIVNRAISYTLTNGKISKIRLLNSDKFKLYASDKNTEYTESKLRLKGNATINVSANTVVAIPDDDDEDVINFKDISALKDGAEYNVVYAFDKNTDDNTAGMILFGEAGAVYSEETPIAIVTKTASTRIDGENYTRLTIYEAGKTKTIEAEADEKVIKIGPDGYNTAADLEFGDVIVYDTDSKGYVKEIRVIMTAATEDNAIGGTANFIKSNPNATAPFGANFEGIFGLDANNYVAGVDKAVKYPWTVAKYGEDLEDAQFAFGVVKERSSSSNTLTLYNQAGKEDDALVIKTNADTNVYVYDITGRDDLLEVGDAADIALAVSSLEKDSFVKDGSVKTEDIAQWFGIFGEGDDAYELSNVINYAMVKMFDGVAQDIVLVIVNEED